MDSMREAFARAVSASQVADTTFAEVSTLLADSRGIGVQHTLWLEWDSLRQRWRRSIQASRGNAKQIAVFLTGQEMLTDFGSLSKSSLRQRQKLIDGFLADIPIHRGNAMKIADEFQALVDCLEIFPSKVKAHIESMRSSFWMSLWGFIKRVTTFILDHKALILSFGAELLTFFGSNTAHLGYQLIQLAEQATSVQKGSELKEVVQPEPDIAAQMKEPATTLAHRVSWEVNAWHSIEQNCLALRSQYEAARKLNKTSWVKRVMTLFSNTRDSTKAEYVIAMVKSRDTASRALIECLEAYSQGLPPPECSGPIESPPATAQIC